MNIGPTKNTRTLLSGLTMLFAVCHADAEVKKPRAIIGKAGYALLQTHCERCHGVEKQKGNFRIDDLSTDIADLPTAERWQKILNALNSGEMPPEEEKQPSKERKADLLDELSNAMVTARRLLADQNGTTTMRRLNRREYRNTLRELLGVTVDVSELPSDTGGKLFDTVGANLFFTGNQFEQYEAIGREALDEAFQSFKTAGFEKTFRYEPEKTHPVFLKRNKEAISAIERGKAWMQAVDEAAAKLENAKVVEDLRKIAASNDALRYHWKKIPGAPSPTEHGFDQTTEINPAIIYRNVNNPEFIPYDAYYLTLPQLETGIYLTLGSGYGGTNFNGIMAVVIPQEFEPGEYVIKVRAGFAPGSPPERRFFEFGIKGYAGSFSPPLSSHHVSAPIDNPQTIEIPFTFLKKNVEKGHRQIFIREKGSANTEVNLERIKSAQAQNGAGPEVALWIDWLEITRKSRAPDEAAPGLRVLSVPLEDDSPEIPRERLQQAFADFSREAYRGSHAPDGMPERLVEIYKSRRETGARHREALRDTLASVLSSPQFLYRAEPDPSSERRNLNGLELANRLSYFLWGAPPDARLRELGAKGALLHPAEIISQADRMLADPRSSDFMRSFLTQWLLLDRLDLFQFSQKIHPSFDDATKAACREEVYETFAYLLHADKSLEEFLKADYVVVNALLATYYGLGGIDGDAFRPVKVPDASPRGGLLGMAAIMAMGSNGERSNPVERGAWVLRKLLNDPPPPAPANVPEIGRLAGKLLTSRERLKAHQEDPQCNNCHRKIDPIGFGLENFDAVGRWRTTDSYQLLGADGNPDPSSYKSWQIDPAASMHKGPHFKDYFELRDLIASKSEAFAHSFSAALIEYALGRPCSFSDELLVAEMLRKAHAHHLTPRAFIQALLESNEFRRR